jgi:hypothetical protein
VAIRKPGKKIRLPPRVPAFIATRISGQRGPKRELRHTEFATTEVLGTIEKARALSQGNEIAPSREESLDEITILEKGANEPDVDFEIRQIVALCRDCDERAIFEDVALRIDLDREIREVVRDYSLPTDMRPIPKNFGAAQRALRLP